MPAARPSAAPRLVLEQRHRHDQGHQAAAVVRDQRQSEENPQYGFPQPSLVVAAERLLDVAEPVLEDVGVLAGGGHGLLPVRLRQALPGQVAGRRYRPAHLGVVLMISSPLVPPIFTYAKVGSNEPELTIDAFPHRRRPDPSIVIASILRLSHCGKGDSATESLPTPG